MQGDAAVGQCATHRGVASERVRIVVVVGVDRLDMQLVREGDDLVARVAVAHEKANAAHAMLPAERGQVRVERLDALDDELDPAVGSRQRVEDAAIEHEGAPDFARCLQGVEQGGVVVDAQVATKPDQRRVENLFHARECAEKPAIRAGVRASASCGIKCGLCPRLRST